MDHHHRKVAITALRHHVADVHLIDGDVALRTEVAQFHPCLFNLVAADEEAALRLQHEGRVGRLTSLSACAITVPAALRTPAKDTPTTMADRTNFTNR